MSLKFRIVENNENDGPRETATKDLILYSIDGASVDKIIEALEDSKLYGKFSTNIRNQGGRLEAAITAHFGSNLPAIKKSVEKKQGFLFPVKTKAAMDSFIKDFNDDRSVKMNLLTYDILPGDKILFPTHKNFSKVKTLAVIKEVMSNAGIIYKVEDYEQLKPSLQEQKLMKKLGI